MKSPTTKKLLVAQATGLCRAATRRSERESGNFFHVPVCNTSVPPIPSGQWPDGTGESPVLPVPASPPGQKATRVLSYELWFFAGLILFLNLPLLTGSWASAFAFHPDLVRNGEWWRILTFPFVHVSVYHLLLDATAFFLLYSGLREAKRSNRFAFVIASAFGSLFVSIFAAPQIYSVGLCGLSGVAHGLMAVSALEMMQTNEDKKIFWAGAISFLFVTGKAALESVTGQVVFSQLHFGNLGTPIAVCHAGGILGALLIWILNCKMKFSSKVSAKPNFTTTNTTATNDHRLPILFCGETGGKGFRF